jgi:hypothetical protein
MKAAARAFGHGHRGLKPGEPVLRLAEPDKCDPQYHQGELIVAWRSEIANLFARCQRNADAAFELTQFAQHPKLARTGIDRGTLVPDLGCRSLTGLQDP